MAFDFSKTCEVKITMYDHIDSILEGVSTIYKSGIGCATAAPSYLYTVREPCEGNKLLLDNEREEYHTLTVQCLYVSKRGRLDLQTSIALHCTRVRNPTQNDQKKLGRTIRYLENTRFLPLILSLNKHGIIEWWVDASFAIHDDTKSRTGLCMSLGEGTVYAVSTRQKLNTNSSTESELVGVSDGIPKMIWTRYFMEAQGYNIEDLYICQDNQSAMLLEKMV